MADSTADDLRRQLSDAGIPRATVEAMWPAWWSSDAEGSLSARTELRYTLARRLGLAPRSLFDGRPKFVWRDETKFKNLTAADEAERMALTAFGIAVGRCVAHGSTGPTELLRRSPQDLRRELLTDSPFIDLLDILMLCWVCGVPVIHLTIFPLPQKRMHAMTVRSRHGFAVLLGRAPTYPAEIAYTLAHELGHIALGHIGNESALVDLGDPLTGNNNDEEERAADEYALTLLTGRESIQIGANIAAFNARELADAALREGPSLRISPGILALCLGHSTGRWQAAIGALKVLQPDLRNLQEELNEIASQELVWENLRPEERDYLRIVMGMSDD